MSSHRSSPLRDRLLSNSPDPIKSSILRESGLGWSSPPPSDGEKNSNSTISPLRISKRDSPLRPPPPSLARRSSSSYRHVRNNNLVSKSPFKSQIPTNTRNAQLSFPTSPRRVSGEKRPRPLSMHEQAEDENERPFALKRERRQSRTYQGLIDKEPVTKSPFRHPQRSDSLYTEAKPAPILSRIPTLNAHGSSPARPSLVSRRLHGPRSSGGGRRERRKTVTFDEKCDVVEIDYEEEDGAESEGSDEESDVEMDTTSHTDYESASSHHDYEPEAHADDSYESIQLSDSGTSPLDLDPNSSITGIVEQMLASNTDLETDQFESSLVVETDSHPRDAPSSPSVQGSPHSTLSEHIDEISQQFGQPTASDPFVLPNLKDEPLPEHNSYCNESMEASECHDTAPSPTDTSPNNRYNRTPDRQLPIPPSTASPMNRSDTFPGGDSGGSRPRISQEDVQRRLLQQRDDEPEYLEPLSPTSNQDVHDDEAMDPLLVDGPALNADDDCLDDPIQRNEDEQHLPTDTLKLDFGTSFGIAALDFSTALSVDGKDLEHNKYISMHSGARMEVAPVDVDMDMRSALDRLMDDVAGGKLEDVSMATDEVSTCESPSSGTGKPRMVKRTATDSTVIVGGPGTRIMSRSVSSSSTISVPPPVPPKDNIRSREALILEKRREMRRLEEEGAEAFYNAVNTQHLVPGGRPSRRRSMSTGDVASNTARATGSRLEIGSAKHDNDDDAFADSVERELMKKLERPVKSGYQIREHGGTIYASSDRGGISHMAGPGDVNPGKAWRTVRRPSDMNEFSKQIKEYREREKSAKAYGKVFVKVLGVRDLHVPIPSERTVMTCTLNNGIHFVTTPENPFSKDCKIEQEFELIEHSKLEFTLTLKIRRDPHIIAQFKTLSPPPVVPPPAVQPASKGGGMRSFFSSSPKKSKEKPVKATQVQPQPLQRLPENLARYLKPDGTLARAFICFKDISHRCDTRLFETTFPLIGQRAEVGNKCSTLQVGEIVLQVFRLPPLPGFAPHELPQSLDECHRGLRHINWHKVTYFEGTLTQCGGDCNSWRRRHLRVIGANLVAFNDVTKRATATINLKKAIAVEDGQQHQGHALSPSSQLSSRRSGYDEYDGLYGVERSFRLVFPDDEILFFADTDEEKSRWLDVLHALVGHIPPHPLWAELLWQRQEDLTKTQTAAPISPQTRKPVPSI